MKKQILIIAIFTMALLVGTSDVFAQLDAVNGSAPRGTACIDDALHPVAGKPYTYTLEANPAGGDFLWWATKDPTFVQTAADGTRTYNNLAATLLTVTPGELIAVSGNYNTAGATATVDITWSDALLNATVYNTNPTFVTTLYNNVICADNLKVYQLDPIVAFTVDIINYDGTTPLGWNVIDDQCIDIVSSAVFGGTTMAYLYGENVFVYEVIAANFTGSYTPEFVITGLNAAQTYVIEYTDEAPSTWTAATTFYPEATAVPTAVANTSLGVSIYVRVTVTNNNFENNATDNPLGITFNLAVDGVNSVGDYDVDNGNGTICDQTTITGADQADIAQQTILPRPSLIEGTISPTAPNIELIAGDEQN